MKSLILRIIDKKTVKAQFQLETSDIWIGIFWRVTHDVGPKFKIFHLFICFIPLFPLHITILLEDKRSKIG